MHLVFYILAGIFLLFAVIGLDGSGDVPPALTRLAPVLFIASVSAIAFGRVLQLIKDIRDGVVEDR